MGAIDSFFLFKSGSDKVFFFFLNQEVTSNHLCNKMVILENQGKDTT